LRGGENFGDGQQFFPLGFAMTGGLRTITAVFGTAAGLD